MNGDNALDALISEARSLLTGLPARASRSGSLSVRLQTVEGGWEASIDGFKAEGHTREAAMQQVVRQIRSTLRDLINDANAEVAKAQAALEAVKP